ncbi:MAG TPA: M56 family metallopeptidase [Vicinamibacterales bacterium]
MVSNLSGAALVLSEYFELSLLAKASLILVGGLAITAFAKTARASARHLVIATAFAALIALPLLIAFVPAMAIDVPVAAAASRPAPVSPPIAATPRITDAVSTAARGDVPDLSLAEWARIAWAAGTIAFLVPIASVLWRLSMIRRTGLPVAWHRAELARLADARGVSLPVELLEHEAVPGPMTFGIRRPVIVLPVDAREWSAAELRRALVHEIEHIQRGDWLMQIVARTVAAFYWFHPLVWMAWRRLCLEAERSCDDAVVIHEDSADYADQLVTLARRMSAAPVQPMLGMANRSDLSTRVTAVLDERLRRGRAGLTLAAGTIAVAAAIVLTVAPVRAIAKTEGEAVMAREPQDQERRRIEIRAIEEQQLKPKIQVSRKSRALDRELYEAAQAGDFDGVKELVEAGANPSATIHGDGSPLIGSARSRRTEITRFLLDQGADPNGIVPGDGSPLIEAARNGRYEQVELLIHFGADVNLAVAGDENPLMNAAEHGHLELVKLLVEKGADIHTRIWTERYQGGGEWRTAISQARKNGHMDVVRFLQSRGARE